MNKMDFAALRNGMVDRQVVARGVRSHVVLDALRAVPREAFLPESLQEFAYEDSPLPIAEGQTISQPYIVALMTEALELEEGEDVLEIGTGSGYAAAVLSRIARNVYTVERIGQLAEKAAAVLSTLGYANVHVLHADGTRGWPDHAPYDAIVVAAGGPEVPESLKAQLKIGGRMVIPVGIDRRVQELLRVARVSQDEYKTEDIADVRFVPLVGEEGWAPEEGRSVAPRDGPTMPLTDAALAKAIATSCESFDAIASADLEPLLRREMRASFSSARRRMERRSSIACANAFRASSSSGKDSPSLPSRGIGRTQRGSITTFGMPSILPPNGPHSPGFPSGCGAIRKCETSSTGYVRAMQR